MQATCLCELTEKVTPGDGKSKEVTMLVLSRKSGEAIRIAATVEIEVLEIHKRHVKLGISGPPQVPIHREEMYRKLNDRRGEHTSVPAH
jgi:carbon storage regulator